MTRGAVTTTAASGARALARVGRGAHLALIAMLVVAACEPVSPVSTAAPTANPTSAPTLRPTVAPAAKPTTTSTPTTKATVKPTVAPTPKPTVKPTIAPAAKPTAKPVVDVYYANCDAVRAAGQAPLGRSDPGYRAGLDRDGDGAACE